MVGVVGDITPDRHRACGGPGVLDAHDVQIEEGDVKVLDAGFLNVRLRFALPACSQVYDAPDSQLVEKHAPVGIGGIDQRAASKQQPRCNRAAFADGDSAEVAGVLHAL